MAVLAEGYRSSAMEIRALFDLNLAPPAALLPGFPPCIQHVLQGSVEPIMDQREFLRRQGQRLCAACDMLVPQLMSGEIAD